MLREVPRFGRHCSVVWNSVLLSKNINLSLFWGNLKGAARLRETCTPVNIGKQPYCDNGEGVAFRPPSYPLKRLSRSDHHRGGFQTRPISWRSQHFQPAPSFHLRKYSPCYVPEIWIDKAPHRHGSKAFRHFSCERELPLPHRC